MGKLVSPHTTQPTSFVAAKVWVGPIKLVQGATHLHTHPSRPAMRLTVAQTHGA